MPEVSGQKQDNLNPLLRKQIFYCKKMFASVLSICNILSFRSLNSRQTVHFKHIPVTKDTTTTEVVDKALRKFGSAVSTICWSNFDWSR